MAERFRGNKNVIGFHYPVTAIFAKSVYGALVRDPATVSQKLREVAHDSVFLHRDYKSIARRFIIQNLIPPSGIARSVLVSSAINFGIGYAFGIPYANQLVAVRFPKIAKLSPLDLRATKTESVRQGVRKEEVRVNVAQFLTLVLDQLAFTLVRHEGFDANRVQLQCNPVRKERGVNSATFLVVTNPSLGEDRSCHANVRLVLPELRIVFGNGLTIDLLREVTNVMLRWVNAVFRQDPFHAHYVLALRIVRRLLACRKSVELVLFEECGDNRGCARNLLV